MSSADATYDAPTPAQRLLRRLDEIGEALSRRPDALALIGVGSVGTDLHRLDEHSDLDFFVVVEDAAKPRYLADIDWLEGPCPVAFSFANTADGRKALYEDGIFCEYAVFTVAELRALPFAGARLVWARDGAPFGLEVPALPVPPAEDSLDFHVGEAVTNLFVGLHREARGERLSATRFVQSFAVDHVIAIHAMLDDGSGPRQDPFAVERGVERRFAATPLPLAEMVPGYSGNRSAAAVTLDWLETHVAVDPAIAAAVRSLLAG